MDLSYVLKGLKNKVVSELQGTFSSEKNIDLVNVRGVWDL